MDISKRFPWLHFRLPSSLWCFSRLVVGWRVALVCTVRESVIGTHTAQLFTDRQTFTAGGRSASPLLPLGTPYPNASERDPRQSAMRKCPWMMYTCSGRSNSSLFSACFSHFAWTLSRCWAPRGWRRMDTRCRYGSHAGRSTPTGPVPPP